MQKSRVYQFIFGLIVAAVLSGGVSIMADVLGYSEVTDSVAIGTLGGGCC